MTGSVKTETGIWNQAFHADYLFSELSLRESAREEPWFNLSFFARSAVNSSRVKLKGPYLLKQQELPEEIECFRDRSWHRDPELRIEHGIEAESFVDRVGFCSTLTDSRRPGPSLYIAVCGRRDAHTPRNVQKDPETRLTWNIKD